MPSPVSASFHAKLEAYPHDAVSEYRVWLVQKKGTSLMS
jgi:hypothetical protein